MHSPAQPPPGAQRNLEPNSSSPRNSRSAGRPANFNDSNGSRGIWAPRGETSGDQFLDHLCGLDPREPLVERRVARREAAVVESQEAKHGGMEVVDMNRVLHDVVREITGFAVDGARSSAATGHPHR